MFIQNKFNYFFQLFFLFLLCLMLTPAHAGKNICEDNSVFNIGTGIRDITGPAAEEGMMGYGMLTQKTAGILQRLWARAFIIESPCNGKRVVFVNADLGQVFQGIKQQVIAKLQKKYGQIYSDQNVLLTATHTHSGPGGFSTYFFYNITTLGFSRENFNAIVDGIVAAISAANDNLVQANIKFAKGDLNNISYNRSPTSYLLNPLIERAKYMADRDTEMTLLRFDRVNDKPIGLINWFPIHGVSMNNKNHLITGDNKGYAEYLLEKDLQTNNPSFIAAFAQANAGDVSPNPYGHEGGSGEEGLVAIEKAGRPQYEKAKDLFNHAETLIQGSVDYRHIFIAMDGVLVDPIYTNGFTQKTCPAAIGISMLAGTQDGEGVGWQGLSCSDLKTIPTMPGCEWLTTPCQGATKPIALSTGLMKPYPWTPNILPLQILKIGNVIIVAAPFELTTMTGRRIREAVAQQFPSHYHVVLSTLANAYAGYVATAEEYEAQRYEAASTHFGPWTQAALQQEFVKLAKALVHDEPVPVGEIPPDLSGSQSNVQTGVLFDEPPFNKNFGDVEHDVERTYKRGETVTVTFWGGHPKNNYHNEQPKNSFLLVQFLEKGEPRTWSVIRNDNDWDTEYHWERSGISASLITIVWRMPKDIKPGYYRIVHFGDSKSIKGLITPYVGFSSVFEVTAS